MTVYLTKVWGSGDPSGPLQFSLEGWRERAREVLSGVTYAMLWDEWLRKLKR